MKKLLLSMTAVFMLWFFSSAAPVFAGTFQTNSFVVHRVSTEQHIMLQNILKLFQFFKHNVRNEDSVKQEFLVLQTPEPIEEQPRERASRSFAAGDRSLDQDRLILPEESTEPAENVQAQDTASPDQQPPAQEALPQEDPAALSSVPPLEPPAPTPVPQPESQAPAPAPTSAPIPAASSRAQKANVIIDQAEKYQGVRYVWGGSAPSGFDCSGFVLYLYGNNGVSLPRVASSQFQTGSAVAKSQLQRGDLVFFNTDGSGASHVGVYIGDGEFIHASSGAHKVTISSLGNGYYSSHYLGGRRVLP